MLGLALSVPAVAVRRRLGGAVITTDADAAAWASAVTANSGTYSVSTLAAVSAFCKAAKAAGYWTKLNRINLFCGDQLAACLVPLKVGGGNATDTNVNFVSGDYSEATGLTGNGSTKYLRTGLIPSASLTLNDTHMAIYNRGSTSTVSNQWGAAGPMIFYAPHTGAALISDQYNSTTGRVGPTAAISTPYGFLVASRNGAGEHVVYQGAVSRASASTSGGSLPSSEIYVFAINNGGIPAAHNEGTRGGYSIGSGLNAGDVAAYNTHMEAFQDALGRGVQ